MFYERPVFPIQSVTVDWHYAEALDLATDTPMFRSHTVPIPDAFDSNVVETLDLTAVPSSSISPESHMITIVDTSQFEVDIESLPVQQAVAGLLACSRRYDATAVSDSMTVPLASVSLAMSSPVSSMIPSGQYIYPGPILSHQNFVFDFYSSKLHC